MDAVFGRESDRLTLEQVAASAGVPFIALWLDAPEATLLARVNQRQKDASDADADVVRMQYRQGMSAGEWQQLDASGSVDQVLRNARSYLQAQVSGRMMPTSGATTQTVAP